MKQHELAIAPSGEITVIYSDELVDLLSEGEARIARASHVEPDAEGAGWLSDLSPVGGPVLGPFRLRQEALDAEVEYLRTTLFNLENGGGK